MRLLFLLVIGFALASTSASACNTPHCAMAHAGVATGVAPATTGTIVIKGFAFQPATMTIVAGGKVTWTNRDQEPHVVVSAGAQFPGSPALDTDDSYSTTFARPGTYTYFCSIHPQMVGTIIVK